jgi:alkanesulfonate monooxygenase SsuD/methylene tetrahydromethanopterin reductase-like flavin-dependent oxidoreductase (luciferase family)
LITSFVPNHPPLVVAEQFAMLEALHPGRIDLGIGRAPGTDHATAAALRRSPAALGAEDFPLHLLDLMGLLGDVRTDAGLWSQFAATPVSTSTPWIGLLGSSGYSAELAGYLGLPFSFVSSPTAPTSPIAARSGRPASPISPRWTSSAPAICSPTFLLCSARSTSCSERSTGESAHV